MGALVLLRNSARDSRKGDKLNKRWLGPYRVEEVLGKGVYLLANQVVSSRRQSMDAGMQCAKIRFHIVQTSASLLEQCHSTQNSGILSLCSQPVWDKDLTYTASISRY